MGVWNPLYGLTRNLVFLTPHVAALLPQNQDENEQKRVFIRSNEHNTKDDQKGLFYEETAFLERARPG